MKKIVFALIVLIVMGLSSVHAESIKDSIVQGAWGELKISHRMGYWINFAENNEYTVYYNGGVEQRLKGKYKIVEDKIYTYPDLDSLLEPETIDYIPKDLVAEGMSWTYSANSEDATIYGAKIESENKLAYWDRSRFVDAGFVRKHGGDPVLTIEKQACKIKGNTSVRRGPGSDQAKEQFNLCGQIFSYLPVNQRPDVTLIGRSEEKDHIEGLEDAYWYFVEIKLYPMEDLGPGFGWIYGALLDKASRQAIQPAVYQWK